MSDEYKLKYLTGRRLKSFLAVADRIVPANDQDPGAGTLATAGVVDWAMSRLEPGLRSQLLLLLLVVEVMGIFFGGKPFSKNSAKARDRQLRWMESAPVGLFRMGFFGLKSFVCMGYYTREEIWEKIDYAGPLLPNRPFADPVIRALCQGKMEVQP